MIRSDTAPESPRPAEDSLGANGVERLSVRDYPSPRSDAPTLVYLPGIHGDWTLIGACREILRSRVRVVEMTYPRNVDWKLADYAAAIEEALQTRGIDHAWLLGESFGSQVLWELAARRRLRIDGLILAGGFVAYPCPALLKAAQWLFPRIPYSLLRSILPVYVLYARLRYRGNPAMIQGAREFVARRTPEDLRAMERRLQLIAENDPRPVASENRAPLHHLYGFFDPIVPWKPVARWLRLHSPALQGSRRVLLSDHTILATAARASAEQICEWIALQPVKTGC
ncbi:MAG: alpha/beta hydrolase [Verrucomicrobia bacterium]|nr:alpha/beta hydrolase [Verrucomicrobiota bacterium]